jgi:hypothetical protein
MAQINKGTTYSATNSTVTVDNLNAHVNNATLLPGSISDQVDLAANVDPSSLQISVLSAGLLKKATVLQALGGINPSSLLVKANNLSDLTNATTARTNLGLSNVENKSSATIRSEITSANLTSLSAANVTAALGYTPAAGGGTVSAANVLPGLTSAQITGLSASQIGPGITSAQVSSIASTALPASGASGGTYGSNALIPQITVDALGRITSVTNVGISGAAGGTVTSVGVASTTLAVTNSPVTSNGQIGVNLQASGVTAGTYGSAASVPVVAVNANGVVTGASSQPVLIGANQILSGITSAQVVGLSANQISSGITAGQITGIAAAQVGVGIADSQITTLSVTKISGLGANVPNFLQTPSSTTLRDALGASKTGTGLAVFQQDPTINGYTEGVQTIAAAGSAQTLDISSSTVIVATLTSATSCTFTMPTVAAGKSFTLYLKQPSAGGPAPSATFTSVSWPSGVAPVITQTLSRTDIFSFVSDGTKWYGNVSKNYV